MMPSFVRIGPVLALGVKEVDRLVYLNEHRVMYPVKFAFALNPEDLVDLPDLNTI